MKPLIVIAIATVTTGIGLYMGWQYLRGHRNRQWLVAVHLILGIIGLEVLGLLLRGAPDGTVVSGRETAVWGAGLAAAALLSGFFAAIIVKSKPKMVTPTLLIHATAGLLAFAALVLWGLRA